MLKKLKLGELKEVANTIYQEFRSQRPADLVKKHQLEELEIFKKVTLTEDRRIIDFEDKRVVDCVCGHSQLDVYSGWYTSGKKNVCEKCGGVTSAFVKLVDIINKDGVIAVVNYIVSKHLNKKDDDLKKEYSLNVRDFIAYSDGHVVSYYNSKIGNHLPRVKDVYESLMSAASRSDEEKVTKIIANEEVDSCLSEIKTIIDKKEDAKRSNSGKTKRAQLTEEFLEKAKEIKDIPVERFLYVTVKNDNIAIKIDETGKTEFPYILESNGYRNNILVNTETNEKYPIDYRNNYSGCLFDFLKFYRDKFNNLFGVKYQKALRFDKSTETLNACYEITGGFFFKENGEAMILDSLGSTISTSNYWGHAYAFYKPDELLEELEKSNQNTYSIRFAFNQSGNEPFETEDDEIVNGDYKAMSIKKLSNMSRSIIDYPFIESLYKTGFSSMANEFSDVNRQVSGLKGARSIYEILGFKNKMFVKEMAKRNPSYTELKHAANIFELDKKKSPIEVTLWFVDNYLVSQNGHIREILQHVPTLARLKEYLENVKDYQCIDYRHTITIFADYLRMASRLGYNLNSKNILYPSSLKKEHDIATFSYNAIKEEMDLKEFQESVNSYKRLEYEEEKKDGLMVIAPEKPEDVIGEGKSLHHCVASYVSRVKDRRSQIMFIRHKETPDESYYTVEINTDEVIIQVRGLQNQLPGNDVKKFISEWAAKRRLIENY